MRATTKSFLRDIRGSLGRFLSILCMVLLGTAFFAGIRATEPAMRRTMDDYVQLHRYRDFRVMSTLGLTEDDLAALRRVPGVTKAQGVCQVDALSTLGGKTAVLRVMNLPGGIALSADGETPLSGVAESAEELATSAGAQNSAHAIGAQSAVAVSEAAVDMNRITLTAGRMPKHGGECVMDAALAASRGVRLGDSVRLASGDKKPLSASLHRARYTVVGLARHPAYLTDDRGTSTIGGGQVDGFLLLPSAAFAAEGYTAIDLGCRALDALPTFGADYERRAAEVKRAVEAIAEARCQERLDALMAEVKEGEQKLADARAELSDRQQEIADGRRELFDRQTELNEKRTLLQRQEEQLTQQIAAGTQIAAAAQGAAGQGFAGIAAQQAATGQGAAAMAAQQQAALADAKAQIDAAKEQLAEGQRTLDAAKQELEEGAQQAAHAEKNIDQEARRLARARQSVEDLGEGAWYVTGRLDEQDYREYGENAGRIGALGLVFPLLFFLVAALVSLTGMTRMVEEQRTQIGLLEALGYGRGTVFRLFAGYCLLATVSGSLVGVALGERLLPAFIIRAYATQYTGVDLVRVPFHVPYALLACVMAVGCNLIATLAACQVTLREVPAQLMRPAPVRVGAHIWLERLGFLWRRLSFSQKATLRNLFRYKRRLMMTVAGIGGCTALILAGFGLRDSVRAIHERQFGAVWTYDLQVVTEDAATARERADLDAAVAALPLVEQGLAAHEEQVRAGAVQDVYLLVPQEPADTGAFFHLQRRGGETLPLSDEGVILTEKAAALNGLSVGDTFSLSREDTNEARQVRVAGIAENYTGHYIYMTPALYEQTFGESLTAAEYQMRFLKWKQDAAAAEHSRGGNLDSDTEKEREISALLQQDAVLQIMQTAELAHGMDQTLGSLDMVVGILIVAAGLLAFIVIFNLNTISITERRRELATLKVLGFYDGEVAGYVYRENGILTLGGIALGLVLGVALHRYIITTVETADLFFGRTIHASGFVLAALLTAAFALLVNALMYFSLKKIDMIESLKSVE